MDIIEATRELGKAIQASEEYKRLQIARTANDEDADLQESIGRFNLVREQMSQEMNKEEKDNDKIQKLNEELQDLYASTMANPNMMEYNIASQELNDTMQKVTAILGMCVNGQDPETCEVPAQGCTGSCATCGGCH